jgi:CheY-like chemotaxis protein
LFADRSFSPSGSLNVHPMRPQAAPSEQVDSDARIPSQGQGGAPAATGATFRPGTVLVCDDRPEVREAILAILTDLPRFQLIGQAGDGADCLAQLDHLRPDVLILDVSVPGGGPELAAASKRLLPQLHIVVYSGRHDRRTQRDMLAAGADQYVIKTGRLQPLVEALDRAVSVRLHTAV